MKKLLSLFISVLMILSLAACSGSQNATGANVSGTNATNSSGKYKESPQLSKLVSDGKLPQIEQRLPAEPAVADGATEIGKYGGIFKGAAFGPKIGQVDELTLRNTGLLTIEPDLKTFKPLVLKDFKVSDDKKTYTLTLRKGMKWSNGDPFTADDFLFWYEDILMNKDIQPLIPNKSDYQTNGKYMKVEKVDDETVKMSFDSPNPSFDIIMAKDMSGIGQPRNFFAPKKYLSQYHIKYNPDADAVAKKENYANWAACFMAHAENDMDATDVHAPDVTPWVLSKIDAQGNKFFDRNPYYFVVDKSGNQLPYIDQQESVLVKDAQVRGLKVISGELDVAAENPLPMSDYTMYKQNEQKGDYTTYLFGNTRGSDTAYTFNLNDKDATLNQIFNQPKFRQAMSLAINRDEINKTLYFGKATVRQAVPPDNTSFYEDWMGKYMTEYSPDKANALLDELGYKWDAAHQVRLMPNGKPFNIVLETSEEFDPQSQMVTEYWSKVGVKTSLKVEERTLWIQRGNTGDRDAQAFTMDSVSEFYLRSAQFSRMRPSFGNGELEYMYNWKNWFDSDGKSGAEPPKEVKDFEQKCRTFSTLTPGSDEYSKLGKELLTTWTNNLYMIGTSVAPRIVIISNKLGNTPTKGTFANDYNFWKPYRGDTWYFK